jgi:hypothetical protein
MAPPVGWGLGKALLSKLTVPPLKVGDRGEMVPPLAEAPNRTMTSSPADTPLTFRVSEPPEEYPSAVNEVTDWYPY